MQALLRLTCVVAMTALGAPAWADDFERLQSQARATGQVSIIATGWQALTGDSDEALGLPDGPDYEALDGNDFVEKLRNQGAQVNNVYAYELLPIIAMTVDAASVATVKAAGSNIEIFEDVRMGFELAESGQMLGATLANQSGFTGKGTVIAVLDSGVDTDHPFLQDRTVLELCYSDLCPNGENMMAGPGAAEPFPDRPGYFHGTHVAGISLGKGAEFSGVAPDAQLIAVNLQASDGTVSTSGALKALEEIYFLAVEQGLPIAAINMSFGSACHGGEIKEWYDLLAEKLNEAKVALISSSGNDSDKSGIGQPACYNDIISVGALAKDWSVAPYSNSSARLDLLAPGGDLSAAEAGGIFSSIPGQGFAYLQGTSMASPQVAGAFAVLRQAVPDAPVSVLLEALEASGRPVADSNALTHPSIDLAAALTHLGVDLNGPSDGTPDPDPIDPVQVAPPKKDPPPEEDKDWQAL